MTKQKQDKDEKRLANIKTAYEVGIKGGKKMTAEQKQEERENRIKGIETNLRLAIIGAGCSMQYVDEATDIILQMVEKALESERFQHEKELKEIQERFCKRECVPICKEKYCDDFNRVFGGENYE